MKHASSDFIVIGLGAMGGAVARHLAADGHRVMGFDRFRAPHPYGSSHGHSRIYRQSYFEDPRYVPLLLRAFELWRQLEQDTGRQILHLTGGLVIGRVSGRLVARSEESAKRFNLPYQLLNASEIRARFPVFHIASDSVALLEDNAGYLVPEECVEQQLALAQHSGAQLHYGEPVLEWSGDDNGRVSVRTSVATYFADRLIIAAGPWAPEVLSESSLPFRVTRQVLCWFQPQAQIDLFIQDWLPIYLFEADDGQPVLYGFPLIGPPSLGVKVAVHGSSEVCTPGSICRDIRAEDERYIRQRLSDTIPSLAGRILRAETCLYTITPDENFILGFHPKYPSIILAAGFSGHGFKFAPVIGEILGQLATKGKSTYDIAMFSPARFSEVGKQ